MMVSGFPGSLSRAVGQSASLSVYITWKSDCEDGLMDEAVMTYSVVAADGVAPVRNVTTINANVAGRNMEIPSTEYSYHNFQRSPYSCTLSTVSLR